LRSRVGRWFSVVVLNLSLMASTAVAQTVGGTVRDETGGALPGVSVELRGVSGPAVVAVSDARELTVSIASRRAATSWRSR